MSTLRLVPCLGSRSSGASASGRTHAQKHVLSCVRKTRYDCKDCGARFEVPLSFAAKGKQMTKHLITYVVDAFRDIRSVSELDRKEGIPTTSIFHILAFLFPEKDPLRVFCINEFRGDSCGSKHQSSVDNERAHRIIDMLPTHWSKDLAFHFSSVDKCFFHLFTSLILRYHILW